MNQENFNVSDKVSKSQEVLQGSQFAALRSLSQLLLREIDSLKNTQVTLEQEIEEGMPINLAQEVQQFEIHMIRCALIRSMGRQNKAAHLLKMKITTLCEKIKRYGITLDA